MKKSIALTVSIICLVTVFSAQIPNPSFENWAGGDPVGWQTSNFNGSPVTQVNNAHSGSSAVKMEFISIIQTGGMIRCPKFPDIYFPYAGRPLSLSGWFISSFTGSDHMRVSCTLMKNGNPIGFSSTNIYTVTSVYMKFTAPITYTVAGNSDSANVELIVFGNGFALVDDLEFETTTTGIDGQVFENKEALQLISDPVLNELRIEYQNKMSGPVKLQLYDHSGRMIRTVLDQHQDAGRYRVYENLATVPEGIYFVKFESTEGSRSQKFILVK